MISGKVNPRFEIIVPFSILDASGRAHPFDAILDTGFSGFLSLPPPVIAVLGLPFESMSLAVLADGSSHSFPNHSATVLWAGTSRLARVAALNCAPLVGTHLLIGFDLRVRFQVGGRVEIEAIP